MNKSAPVFLVIALWLAGCGRSTHADAALKALDPDNDGTVSLAEAQAGATKEFAKLNPDNDQTLDAKELSGLLDAAAVKTADPDNDGTIDAKEYAAIVADKFKAADPDNDGTLDKKELQSPAGKELLKFIYD
jgi:Ca2+-binding EF-hand superfamily protein